jgi:hypothetical protein
VKFRKKPVVIEAEQFLDPKTPPRGVFVEDDGRAYVVTIHLQKCFLEPGDWVIQEPDGEHFYPCKPDIFAATYVPECPDDECLEDAPDLEDEEPPQPAKHVRDYEREYEHASDELRTKIVRDTQAWLSSIRDGGPAPSDLLQAARIVRTLGY